MKTLSIVCCLWYAAVWTEGTIIKIEEIEQREVLFRCSHSFAQSNDKYLCKDPCTQSTDKLVTVKAGGRAVSERITLVDSGNGVFTVIFSQLQMSDSGRYWCAVERIGWDTYTEVNLIVNKDLATETPNRSTTWAYQSISSSTQPTPETNTSSPTNLSATSNYTNGGEKNISTNNVLHATAGTVAIVTILVLLVCFRKCRAASNPQEQVCTDVVTADEREVESSDIDQAVQSITILPESTRWEPPSEPLHIYENICCTAGSTCATANVQKNDATSSGIHNKPLPPVPSERTGGSSATKHTLKPTAVRNVTSKHTDSCTNASSARHSRSSRDCTRSRRKSFWFGLDLSGTI
ncbi:CMRF35-like molecule 1 [Mastacembelus armatus]|uniref:CMRF35-like molecule 1 n=1 Tax=Mastacembelus armatus TaxID=205130 RepID=UPI000E45BCB8|nr:CMRF35-like molecule 1 [Mastacembelus armatus]